MRRFVLSFVLLLPFCFLQAQQLFTVFDTVHIGEVVSYGKLQKYQSGAKIEKINARQFSLSSDGNLEQLLSRTLPIAFKSNAGGLSTIRIRGSAPNHTSINFGGININSLTLGHSNVSNVPMYLFDNVGVQFGSASSVNGSGSIGGAIHLGLNNSWTNGFKAEVRATVGSFGESLLGTKLFLGNGKFETVTRIYYYTKTNDFKFTNPYYRDFENQIFEINDRQHNANIKNRGLLQELNYRFKPQVYFTSKIWLENDWHLIQQNKQTNLSNPEKQEEYADNNLRVWAEFKKRNKAFKYEISGGFVADNSVYNNNSADTISTRRWITEAFIEHDLGRKTSYKTGVKTMYINPRVYAYTKTIDHENRVDFYASLFQQLNKKVTATLNLRQGWVSNFKVPFTPAVGLKYLALSKEKYVLNFTANVARSYRVPTFNDRFWEPGGNPGLNPENGMNYELGSKWSYCDGNISGNIKINAFLMNIDDWILWKNGGAFWYAENVQNVVSKGIELMTEWNYRVFNKPTKTGFNYTLTSAQRVKSETQSSALHRQLEYVPLHSANWFTEIKLGKIDWLIDGNFVDKQFTDEEEKNLLEAVVLFNISASYHIRVNTKNNIRINAMVNNLFNADYEASWGYAMPGINYRLSMTYNFN